MPTRYDIERALEASDLEPPARHIVMVLCTRMQQGSTVILQQHSPSLTRLARGTGWSRRTIMRHLAKLEDGKWIERRRPPPDLARTVYMTTLYVVHEPDSLGSQGPALGPEGPALGPEGPALGPEGPALGPEGPALGPGSTAYQNCSDLVSDPESDPEIRMVIEQLLKRTGRRVDAGWAAKIRDQLLARPGAGNRSRVGYLKRVLSTDPRPDRFIPAPDGSTPWCTRCGKHDHQQSECPY